MAQETHNQPYDLVEEIRKDIFNNSPRPIFEASLVAALALVAGIVGGTYHVNGMGLNVYLLLLAGTGTGKDSMSGAIVRLLEEVRKTVPAASFFGPKPVSAQGLFKALAANPSFVSHQGEAWNLIQQLCSPKADPNSKALLAAILDLHSKTGPNGKIPMMAYSDTMKNIEVPKGAAFTLLGDSTASEFRRSFDERHVLSGFMTRMSVVEFTGDVPPLNLNRYTDPALVERLATLCSHTLSLRHRHEFQEVLLDEGAQRQFKWAEEFHLEQMNSKLIPEVEKALWSRRNEKAYRIAALIAVGCNAYGPVINEQQAAWALGFEEANTLRLISAFEEGEVGEQATSEATQQKRVMAVIKDWFSKPWAELERYKINKGELMRASGVIPYSYISKRLTNDAAFKNAKLGATATLKKTIDELFKRGDLQRVTPKDVQDRFNTTSECYAPKQYNEVIGEGKAFF